MMNKINRTSARTAIVTLLAILSAVLLGLVTSVSSSSAQVGGVGNGQVNWNGWNLTYGVESGSDGLRLNNVTHDGTLMMSRISLPTMNVFYEIPGSEGGCGPYADLVGGTEYDGVFVNEFTQNGEQWLELAIEDQIGAYIIYQSYYFSESGVLDAHIFSKALQCNIYHEHLPFWRMDFDVDGPTNDEVIRLNQAGSYVSETTEFDFSATSAVNHEWYVRDSVTSTAVRINFDDGTYNLPGEIVPETNYIENNIYGRNYSNQNPEIVWQSGPTRDLAFNNGENINDLVLWYTGFMPHSPEEGPDLWHSTGVRMQVVPDPMVMPPTPVPPTTVPTTGPTTVPTTVPPTVVPPTPVPADGCLSALNLANNANGFGFDASQPYYTNPAVTDAGLEVAMGGEDETTVENLAAAFIRTCANGQAQSTEISVTANLTQTGTYESDEYSTVGVTVNGDFTELGRITGDGNAGGDLSTGMTTYTIPAALTAGNNVISLDCFNNKKTWTDELTTCVFEALSISPEGQPIPTPTPVPGGSLASGVPVTGIAGAQGEQAFFTVDVPANTASLEVVMTGTGDADLYTLFGGIPSDEAYDCRPYTDGSSDEVCSISFPPAGLHNIMINGWTAYSDVSLTATVVPQSAGGGCVLTNGTPAAGLAGAQGDSIMCTVEVPAGAADLRFNMTGDGDGDIYTRFGAAPTLDTYDCRPYVDGTSVEACPENGVYATPEAGTYYVMVNGWAAFSNVSLTATWNLLDNELTSGDTVTGLSGIAGSEQQFTIDVPSGTAVLEVVLSGGTGDADLYTRAGGAPALQLWDCRPYEDQTNDEICTIENPAPGTHGIMVHAYRDFADAELFVVFALPGTVG